VIYGHDEAIGQFRSAWDKRTLHHAWLLAGPKGVGKATFAYQAARRLLAEAAGPNLDLPGLQVPDDHPVAKLITAGSHPDMRSVKRLENDKGNLNRNIKVDQIRELREFIALSPAMSPWRVAVIDSVDELEASGANALLKMLEEPPPNTAFFLVSHAPGRLLPTIRSRCRRLDFRPLGADAMASVLARQLPNAAESERNRLGELSGGLVGRALAVASLDLGPLEEGAIDILERGDPDNSKRLALATQLGRKAAADRYAAFLDLLPSLVSAKARSAGPGQRERALDAYEKVRELVAVAPRLSLDPAATVFQLSGILASVAD
jgi:DNA polymerase-3 subunit delta'